MNKLTAIYVLILSLAVSMTANASELLVETQTFQRVIQMTQTEEDELAQAINNFYKVAGVSEGMPSDYTQSLARLIPRTSMVSSSKNGKYTVLYNIYGDYFVIIGKKDGRHKFLFISGKSAFKLLTHDSLEEDSNKLKRIFKIRPLIQDNIATLFDAAENNITGYIENLYLDDDNLRQISAGMYHHLQGAVETLSSPCMDPIATYTNSPPFEKMFKTPSDARRMQITGIANTPDGKAFVMQDKDVARIYFFLIIDDQCHVTQVLSFDAAYAKSM
jgi:hypothetical protein